VKQFVSIFILAMAVFLISDANARANKFEETFFKANQAYGEGRFQEAIQGYDLLIRSGHRNGHLYYNLGNAYFKTEQLGPAILNYERAYLIMPRDADLNFNLSYARDQMRDAIPQSQGFLQAAFFWLDSLSMAEMFWAFALMNVLFWGTLFMRLFLRTEWTYYLFLILLIFWLIGGTSFGLKCYQKSTDDRAVILKQEVSILAGPDVRDTVLFKLHEGTIVHHERSEDGWSLVHLPDRKRGWVKAEAVELILAVPSEGPGPLI
jgi:tetratricopeptide (TPR) repeat protein